MEKDYRLRQLLHAKKDVWNTLQRHRDDIDMLRTKNMVHIRDILKCSGAVTLTSQPPAGWVEGNPLIRCHYPAPVSEEMRAGVLLQLHTTASINRKDYDNITNDACVTQNNILVDVLLSKISENAIQFQADATNSVLGITDSAGLMVENFKAESQSAEVAEIQDNNEELSRKRQRKIEVSYGLSDSDDSDGDA